MSQAADSTRDDPGVPPASCRRTGFGIGETSVAPVLLAALAALSVAGVLVPAEAAAQRGTHAVLVVLWLVLTVGWWAAGLLGGERPVRFGAVDAAVAVLMGLHVASAAMMAGQGSMRASINAGWQWAALGLVFFLARQLLDSAVSRRAVCSVMVGLGVGLSVHGFYQYAVGMPAARAEYRAHPERVLRQQGIPTDPQSPARRQYENRLDSTEPPATFSLANSLAGYLVPWLVVVLGIGTGGYAVGTGSGRRWLLAGCCMVPMAACLLLTKSRAGYLAAMAGAAAVVGAVRGKRIGRLAMAAIVSASVIVIVGLAVGAVAIGALDFEVLSEAPKSIVYRLEYWRATARMIADYPVLGCGPGNFQDYYTAYKLPQASETVADPHNFVLEIWATAGTPALLAALAVGLFAVRRILSTAPGSAPAPPDSPVTPNSPDTPDSPATPDSSAAGRTEAWAVYIGAAAGVLVAFPCGYLVDLAPDPGLLWGLLPAAGSVALLDGWTRRGQLPVAVPAMAVGALLLNLLVAGGIGFAGVANSLWLLLAMALNTAEDASGDDRAFRTVGRGARAVGAAATLVLLAVCHQTLYRPVLMGQMLLPTGRALRFQAIDAMRQGDVRAAREAMRRAEAVFTRAARADRFSSRARLELASLNHDRWLQTGAVADWKRFERFVGEGLERNVRSAAARRQVGQWYLEAYRATGGSSLLQRAIDAFGQAVTLSPADAMIHAEWAWAYHLAGDASRAAEEAEIALALDAKNPHADKKLAGRSLADPGPWPKLAPLQRSGPSGQNVEQRMRQLRKLVRDARTCSVRSDGDQGFS